MVPDWQLIVILAGFGLVALASKEIGRLFQHMRMPLISGFLLCGILAGPFVLGLISEDAPQKLRFLDQICLGFIALAAGAELSIKELRGRLGSIAWVTAGLVLTTFTLGSCALFLLSAYIPFMQSLPVAGRIAVSILGGAILVARSPSSAIAVVTELRAKGRFTQTVLGVTVLMDVVVITLFALNSSVAGALFTDMGIDIGFVPLLATELVLAIGLGYALGKFLQLLLLVNMPRQFKAALLIGAGFSVFVLSSLLRSVSLEHAGHAILFEPLLVCMLGGFFVTNFTDYRAEMRRATHDIGPAVFIVFFTLTGASLDLHVLATTWTIAVILFLVRIVAIAIGTFTAGTLAGDPARNNRISWMAYITQAGIGLGLAKQAAAEFPECGLPFATILTAVIVLNQIAGPPFFKWAIQIAGEAHKKADPHTFDGARDTIIFGLEDQSVALAKQLLSHGWNVRIASRMAMDLEAMHIEEAEVDIRPIENLTIEALRSLAADKAEALVLMLSDEENLQICEMAYEHLGTEVVVVRVHDRTNFQQFHDLGALVVEPSTAIVGLMENFVRSPDATSIMMGMEEGQDIVGLAMLNPDLHGTLIRDVGLPLDIHLLAIRRHGRFVVVGGYNPLNMGDHVTLAGSVESLEKVALLFEQ